MLRISLIIALVASIAALVVSQIRVAEKINGLTTELDTTKQTLSTSQVAETKAKKELIVAKKHRAQTQEAIQRTVRGLGNINAMDKLDQLEERVDDRLAQADAMAKLESGTLESKFRDLEKDQEVDAELAELKRRLGQQ